MNNEESPPDFLPRRAITRSQSSFQKIQEDLEKMLAADGFINFKVGEIPMDDRIRTRNNSMDPQQNEVMRKLELFDKSWSVRNQEPEIQNTPAAAKSLALYENQLREPSFSFNMQDDDDDEGVEEGGDYDVPVKPLISFAEWEQITRNNEDQQFFRTLENPETANNNNNIGDIANEESQPSLVNAAGDSSVDDMIEVDEVDKNDFQHPDQTDAGATSWSTWFSQFFFPG